MTKKYILSFDQGTTSSRAILFDKNFEISGIEQIETTQVFPRSGWVEQDASEIWETQLFVARKLIARLGISTSEIASIGITNQRESTVIWHRNTGIPVYNAIIWQDKRTSDFCEELKKSLIGEYISEVTGLVVDSYFSATKIKWILDNIKDARKKALAGDLLFGTIDSWLIWNLTGGRLHITDYSNASRTMIYNIRTFEWDKKILEYLDIPEQILPEVVESSSIYGCVDKEILGKSEIPIGGIAGDQQAALFGHACFNLGTVKNTYGTGCFMLMNVGQEFVKSDSGLITTIAWNLNGQITYALEGSVFVAGAVIKWLRDNLKIVETASETQHIATQVEDTAGVYFVPAFAGLGAPYWDMKTRGNILGITSRTNYKHIVRAALESIAYQTKDVLMAMEKDSKIKITELNVDGGASSNDFLLQFQSDILGININRPPNIESTALGVAFLAGLSVGFWTLEDISGKKIIQKTFYPEMDTEKVATLYSNWLRAIEKSKEN